MSTVLTTASPNGTLVYIGGQSSNLIRQRCNTDLAGDLVDNTGQVMIFDLPVLHPRGEVAQLPVVSIVRQPHLWANVKDLVVVDDHTTVVDDVLVDDRPIFS